MFFMTILTNFWILLMKSKYYMEIKLKLLFIYGSLVNILKESIIKIQGLL